MDNRPNIEVVYRGRFPDNYINDVNGWAFSEKYIKENLGKLLTLDIDFGIKCSLNCPHCFRKNNPVDDIEKSSLKYDELITVLDEAKALGLKSVKFLGKGEPFESGKIIELLKYFKKNDIIPLIFTKGHIIGDDNNVKKYFSKYGIYTSKELIEFLNEVNASILLGFNSFDKDIQNKMVGDGKFKNSKKTYWDLRNKALELLVEAGFNKHNPTRLCLATNPLTKDNYDEIFEIYKWGRERNMYVIVTPSMISGRAHFNEYWKEITPSPEKIIKLYTDIYIYNIQKNIQTFEQVLKEGIASYAGGHPCNQISVGMYITLNGTVLRCPGDDITVLGNVRFEKLESIWKRSENYGRCGQFNCGCPPKWGKSIPYNLFTEVMLNLKRYFGDIV